MSFEIARPNSCTVFVEPTPEACVERARALVLETANMAIDERGRFLFLLSGGRTPRTLYEQLARTPSVAWERWELWLGDERNVMPEDPGCNFRLVRESLLEPLAQAGQAAGRVRRWRTEDGPEVAADDYAQALGELSSHGAHVPQFDLVLLGLGEDGHTAGLFPGTTGLSETSRLAIAHYVPALETVRLTVTFPLLNAARRVLFLATGAKKADPLFETLYGEFDPSRVPAQAVRPTAGSVDFLVDAAAASRLDQPAAC